MGRIMTKGKQLAQDQTNESPPGTPPPLPGHWHRHGVLDSLDLEGLHAGCLQLLHGRRNVLAGYDEQTTSSIDWCELEMSDFLKVWFAGSGLEYLCELLLGVPSRRLFGVGLMRTEGPHSRYYSVGGCSASEAAAKSPHPRDATELDSLRSSDSAQGQRQQEEGEERIDKEVMNSQEWRDLKK